MSFRQNGISVFLIMIYAGVLFGQSVPDSTALNSFSQELSSDKTADASKPGISKRKAFLLSFVLPGSGEYFAGSKKMAGIFFGLETVFWATHLSFRTYGDWKRHDYQQYAAAHAGVNLTNKPREYFVHIEDYTNIRAYNDEMLQLRDLNAMYPENEFYSWQWDSESNREKFESMRISSDRAYNRATIVVAGIIINHLASGIDAMRIVRHNEKSASAQMPSSRFVVSGLPEGGAVVSLWASF